MNIVWASNAPWAGTGYGVQTALVVERMLADGHRVAVASNFGHQASVREWHGIPVLPSGYDQYSNDIIPEHARHWFGGEPGAGWIITLFDVWVFDNPLFRQFNIASWTPVDHKPAPEEVVSYFHRMGAVPIAMSKFGRDELERRNLSPLYAPHAVDTKVFCPDGPKAAAKTLLKLPADAYVVLVNGNNKGMQDRKNFAKVFQAFSVFARDHDDAILWVHTEQFGLSQGLNLGQLSELCGIPEDRIWFSDQYRYRLGFAAGDMATMYRAADVLVAPSKGEGFGVPVIEAQACGTPVIVSNFTAQPELVGHGWLVDGEPDYDPFQRANWWYPYAEKVYEALAAAYAERTGQPSEVAVEFAAGYDADLVYERDWKPVLAALEERTPTLEPVKATPL